jgi:hypothetical protein
MPPDERPLDHAPHARQRKMCQAWDEDHDYQVLAGRARAALRTPEDQSQYGGLAWLAFMTRFRAQVGQAPYTTAGLHYIGPDDIRIVGTPLAPHLAQLVYQAWCQSDLRDVSAILYDPPPEPGSLWALPHESSSAAPQAQEAVSPCAPTLPGAQRQASVEDAPGPAGESPPQQRPRAS